MNSKLIAALVSAVGYQKIERMIMNILAWNVASRCNPYYARRGNTSPRNWLAVINLFSACALSHRSWTGHTASDFLRTTRNEKNCTAVPYSPEYRECRSYSGGGRGDRRLLS